ncbi:MAG: aldehyde dehydrogenase family protein [Caldisericia bacterium]|nr:aldehyde dehydrogenase family protein [Caldisericia bacterium]
MHLKNYINGVWKDSVTGRTFEDHDPANGDLLAIVTLSSAADVNEAVFAAKKAQQQWRLVPAPVKGDILMKASRILEERKEDIARELTCEMGKVIAEARGDVQEAIDMFNLIGGEGRRLRGETVPSEMPNKTIYVVRDPIGVCGLITPWNFPTAIPTWKIAPALVCGNTVVVKPATETPRCMVRIFEALIDAGLKDYPGVINLVLGGGGEVGEAILASKDISMISFTGSTDVGRRIATVCGETLKRSSLEMGGKNAIIVMDDADLHLAVDSAIWSAYGTTGQRCTACSRLIVHRKVKAEFEKLMIEAISKLKLGHGLKSDVGPVINMGARRKIDEYVQIGKNEGAKLLVGGENATEGELAKGSFYKPTLFTDCTPNMRVCQEEIFGPVATIIPFDTLEEAIQINNNTAFGLSSAIITNNVNNAMVAARDITTGLVYINAGTIGAEVSTPFGGTRGTGNGHREGGVQVLDAFSEWKTVTFDFSGHVQKAQIDNK